MRRRVAQPEELRIVGIDHPGFWEAGLNLVKQLSKRILTESERGGCSVRGRLGCQRIGRFRHG
jgi:hypothetical protein